MPDDTCFYVLDVPIDEKIIDMTLNSKFGDFEDGLQYFTSKENNIKMLIMRNGSSGHPSSEDLPCLP
jgi:hypothetical protein